MIDHKDYTFVSPGESGRVSLPWTERWRSDSGIRNVPEDGRHESRL